jgi:hypothetical protein
LHAFNTAADEKINADKHLCLRSPTNAKAYGQALMVKLAGV